MNYVLWDNTDKVARGSVSAESVDDLGPAPEGREWIEIIGSFLNTTLVADGDGTKEVPLTMPADIALEAAQAGKWEAIKVERDAALLVAATSFGVFDADATALTNINGQVSAITVLGSNAPSSVVWRMHDNSMQSFTPSDFVKAALEVAEYRSNIYQRSWSIEAEINAATTVDAVNGIAGLS